ncbi:hypothetical protein A9Q94_19840 [Rhodobacterales bacterium 56_14_T64]|nr:hypothetical protein A9Q94_19840 [Rhodobacterales bacterium 56_14_T64]
MRHDLLKNAAKTKATINHLNLWLGQYLPPQTRAKDPPSSEISAPAGTRDMMKKYCGSDHALIR